MSGQPVHVTGRLSVAWLQRLKQLLPEAITRAIYATSQELEQYKMDPSMVPIDTGKLAGSLVKFVSPGQIVLQWSALSPQGYNYAKLRDELGGKQVAPGWSQRWLVLAKELLQKNLLIELQAIGA